MRSMSSAWASVVGSSFFTDIADFLHEQAALVTAGRWLDLNEWAALGVVALALLVLIRGSCWIKRHFRRFARLAVLMAFFSTMMTAYYVAMLAYGLFWFLIYQEMEVYVRYDQRLELAIATVGAALLAVVLGIRIFGRRRSSVPRSHARPAAARARR